MTESPLPRILLIATGVVVALWSLADIAVSAVFLGQVSHVSGAWMVLARDLAQGVFYRPLFDPVQGYGGTRFMPLFFSLHAGLIRLGAQAIPAGIALSLVSGLALVAAVVALLRTRGVHWITVILAAAALLSFLRIREGFTSIRGDLLPVAFAVCGACLFLRARPPDIGKVLPAPSSRRRLIRLAAAGLLFALAFLTKITSLFAVAAAFSAASLEAALHPDSRRTALTGAIVTGGVFLVVSVAGLVATQLLSDGRFLETFRMSAAGGAQQLTPWSVIRGGLGGLKWQWESNQVSFRAVLVLGTALSAWQGWRLLRGAIRSLSFEVFLFLYTLAGTVIILSSPGAAANHLVDLMVAGVLLVAVGLDRAVAGLTARRIASFAAPVILAGVSLLGMRTNVPILLDRRDLRPEYDLLAAAVESDRLVLAENPAVLVHAGKEARVLDTFMLRVIRERDAQVSSYFLREIRDGVYDALLLSEPQDAAGRLYLERMHFGPGFREALAYSYERHETIGTTAVYRPQGLP